MHCQDPGCLKACPSPGAIVQYANGIVDFHEEACIAGLLHHRLSFNIRGSRRRITKPTNARCAQTVCPLVSSRVHQVLPDGAWCSAPRTT